MLGNNKHFVKVLKKSLDRRRAGNTGSVRSLPRFSDFFADKKDTLSNSYQKESDEIDE
jgi:hypothetical protein